MEQSWYWAGGLRGCNHVVQSISTSSIELQAAIRSMDALGPAGGGGGGSSKPNEELSMWCRPE